MYLLYADESGDLRTPDVSYFVVAGIAVHEDAIRPFAGEINKTINRYLGRDLGMQLEVHGNPIRFGSGLWNRVSEQKRHALARVLLDKACNWQHLGSATKPQPFAVVIDRDHSSAPTETAYGELLHLFDEFLRGGRRRGNPHNGVLVGDRSRYQRTIEAWVQVARARVRRPAQDPRRLHALAETPFFVDSKSTRLMQVADLVAYAFYRAYSADDWSWADQVVPTVTSANPCRLVHFTSESSCECPACQRG